MTEVTSERLRPPTGALFAAAVLLVVATTILGIGLGSVAIAPGDTVAIVAHRLLGLPATPTWPATAETIVLDRKSTRLNSSH